MANTFDWVEIRTNDIEKSANFYESLFGWKVTDKGSTEGFNLWIFNTQGEPRIDNLRRGGIWARPSGEAQGVIVYIVVEKIDALLTRVKELGGEVTSPITEVGGGYVALIADPCGNQFGLYQDKVPG